MALACAWTLWTNLAGSGVDQAVEAQPQPAALAKADALRPAAASAYGRLATALNAYARRSPPPNRAVALFDSRWLGVAPGTFVKRAALQADRQAVALLRRFTNETTEAVASMPSPAEVAQSAAAEAPQLSSPPARTASLHDGAYAGRVGASPGAEKPTIFEKLFGKPAPLTLAYAAPDDGGLSNGPGASAGRYDRQTAVYDISAHMVYLPDGTQLEAHSGLGSRIDDPRHTDERMRGATPATVYDLKLREAPFHGVQALRLVPVDEEKVFGRSGLLAHTYMLGPNGQSFGCVSFRNYNAFLRAYLSHEIKRLVVVSRLD